MKMGLRLWEKYFLLFIVVFLTVVVLSLITISSSSNTINGDSDSYKLSRDIVARKSFEEKWISNGSNSTIDGNSTADVEKQNYVKQMMKHSWDNYKKFAWGSNELRPLSKMGHSGSVFGAGRLGATIVDAVDTLYIMGLNDEYADARQFIVDEFDVKNGAKGDLSVFETNIRFVGGLLSIYALTGENVYLEKAKATADLLLPAFNTATGIPLAIVNVRTGRANNWGWASGGCSILSELGTLELEFNYLSKMTGNDTYANKIKRIREVLTSVNKPDGLYPNYINPNTGKWCQKHISVGALGDSFYEYLLKQYVISNKKDVSAKKLYDDAIEAIENNLLYKSAQNNLWYFAELKNNRVEHKMDHLACFIAGLFALQSSNEIIEERKNHFLELAVEIGNTCHESYIRTDTGIGPESFRFTQNVEAKSSRESEKYYILRPEVIEGWFYLWRITKQQKYRDWCWSAVQAIEKYCRTDNGYTGVRNVYSNKPDKDDVQQSFWLAETLKYLYLVFSDDAILPLNKWVFNTEAHPLPIDKENNEENHVIPVPSLN